MNYACVTNVYTGMLNSAHRDDWPVLFHDADFIQRTDDVDDTHTHTRTGGGWGNLEFETLSQLQEVRFAKENRRLCKSTVYFFTHMYSTRLN
jgi:hypothetical protein